MALRGDPHDDNRRLRAPFLAGALQGPLARNVTLDFVRGIAILGILLLNITAFGLPKAAYLNPAWYGDITRSDAWTWALLDLFAQVKFLTLFALLFGAGLQLLLKRGTRWIQSRLTLLVLFGLVHALFFWDGDILLAYGLVGLICWRLIRDAHSVKSLFNTGVMLYLMGVAVLLLLGFVSHGEPGKPCFWQPDAANLQYEQFWKLKGGTEAISNRADMLGDNLLALGAQYGWQLAGMMLMGAALMRTGWLKGAVIPASLPARQAAWLVLLGVLINLPAVALQWLIHWDYRWCAFLLQVPRELGAPLQTIGYPALFYGFWPALSRLCIVHWLCACVGRMALSNYLLQTLICTTLFYRFGLFMRIRPPAAAGVCSAGLGGKPGVFCALATLFPPGTAGVGVASVNRSWLQAHHGTQIAEVNDLDHNH